MFKHALCGSALLLGLVGAKVVADGPKPADRTHAVAHAPVAVALVTDAVAVLAPSKASDGKAAGTIVFKAEKGYVLVTGEVTGLTPGKHGFHIHMFGDLRAADGTSAGGHYNPDGHEHGGPDSESHHAGDLGNIEANSEGVAKVQVKSKDLKIQDILGRSVVVHGDADDLKSQPSGNAGPRVALGVIGLADGAPKAK
ncbi:MAG: superoxide dismutase family protein [Pirellulales bacterium]